MTVLDKEKVLCDDSLYDEGISQATFWSSVQSSSVVAGVFIIASFFTRRDVVLLTIGSVLSVLQCLWEFRDDSVVKSYEKAADKERIAAKQLANERDQEKQNTTEVVSPEEKKAQ